MAGARMAGAVVRRGAGRAGPVQRGTARRWMSSTTSEPPQGIELVGETAEEALKVEAMRKEKEREKKKGKNLKAKGEFLCMANSLAELDHDHEGFVYELTGNQMEFALPEGALHDFAEDVKLMETPSFMVRKPFLDIKSRMDEISATPGPATYNADAWMAGVLTGERGIGKSVALMTAVMHARAAGWLTLFMPDSRDWVTDKTALELGTGTAAMLLPSKHHHGMLAQPIGAQRILGFVHKLHGAQLKNLPLRRSYAHSNYNAKSLLSVVEYGLQHRATAGDALMDLRLEFSLVEELPVLVAVDQANAFYWPTAFYAKGEAVAPSSLLAAAAFRPFDTAGRVLEEQRMTRGLILSATTAKFGWPVRPDEILEHYVDTRIPYFRPYDVRGAKLDSKVLSADESLRNQGLLAHDIAVSPFDEREARHFIINLRKQKLVYETNKVDYRRLRMIMAVTGAVPRHLRDAVMFSHVE